MNARPRRVVLGVRAILTLAAIASAAPVAAGEAVSAGRNALSWTNGPLSESSFFPLAVWLQSPTNAKRYREASINTYVGLWEGPTEEQLAKLKQAGMRVICEQNEVSLRHLDDPTIIGWMGKDEPDNAQSAGARLGWSAPIPPAKVVEQYRAMRIADPARPVLLNLGQGVAWDGWHGRGTRKNHPEDYREYLKGCDIASFDIYPAVHPSKEVAGKLWYVARGVERLVDWTDGRKLVWNCLECTRVQNPDRKPTPHEVRAEAWMSLIHGSRGLIYFAHQFKPKFIEAALLEDAEMLAAVTALNRQITELAPVLNSPALRGSVQAVSKKPEVPVALMVKQHRETVYVFAVAMRADTTTATFTFKGTAGGQWLEVIGEKRMLAVKAGQFSDEFGPWDVHLYRVSGVK